MTKTTEPCAFQPSDESGLYLSLIKPAWQSTVINKALGRYLSEQAMIDITDGKGVVSFWRKLDFHKKAEVVRRLANCKFQNYLSHFLQNYLSHLTAPKFSRSSTA